MPDQKSVATAEQNLAGIRAIVGAAHLLTDEESIRFYSTDIFRQATVLSAGVVQPGTVDELQAVMRLCARHKIPTVVRGGGASYTDAYLPVRAGTLTLDMGRLTRIDIHPEDLYVTVEPGVTWAALYAAVTALDLRTPMWGPFSGLTATVGGGMSHYAVNYGSGLYGVSAESLLSMDILLASGEMLSTGSAGGSHSLPFFRHYGPDLAGLFVGDAGALGVKARMTLRLMKKPGGLPPVPLVFPRARTVCRPSWKSPLSAWWPRIFPLIPARNKSPSPAWHRLVLWPPPARYFSLPPRSGAGQGRCCAWGLRGAIF